MGGTSQSPQYSKMASEIVVPSHPNKLDFLLDLVGKYDKLSKLPTKNRMTNHSEPNSDGTIHNRANKINCPATILIRS
jgi:hypothetical protein